MDDIRQFVTDLNDHMSGYANGEAEEDEAFKMHLRAMKEEEYYDYYEEEEDKEEQRTQVRQ
jgi:hypothetical protein